MIAIRPSCFQNAVPNDRNDSSFLWLAIRNTNPEINVKLGATNPLMNVNP